ncbi:MAG: hypothetical protein AB7T86_15130 [Xanthobacteraceae bacterium]|uniref:hypothetical protein n=1 Tax=Pseudolabrys sp. TaxID=1960880 RepID=UPI003D09AA01
MAFITGVVSSAATVPANTVPRRSFFVRVLNALIESRQRHADREIAQYLKLTGGKLTDDVERNIERRFLKG